ncbi:MAG: DoxX-like family protein, partial [Pseudomonadales bacterium]|nr:DoxX-like family protein [Pseudomonadales bacterium]
MNNSQPSKFINLSLAFLWGYQGLVPKILFINPDEIAIWQTFGFSYAHAQLAGRGSGILECIFALLFLLSSSKYL